MPRGTFDKKRYKYVDYITIEGNLKKKGFKEIVRRDDNEELVISYGIDNDYLDLKEIINAISKNKIYKKNNQINIDYRSYQLPYSEFFKHLSRQTFLENKYITADRIRRKIKELNEDDNAKYQETMDTTKITNYHEIESLEKQLDNIYQDIISMVYSYKTIPDHLEIIYHEPQKDNSLIELRNKLQAYKDSEIFNNSTHEIIERMEYETPSFKIILNKDKIRGYTIDVKINKKEFLKNTRIFSPEKKTAKLNNILMSFKQ